MFNIKGLTDEEVVKSRNVNGNNAITHYKKNTFLNLVLESLNDPIIKILLIALGIKILFLFNDSDVYETIGIIVAIILASVISSLSEFGSEKAFEKLSSETSKISAKVIRNSKLMSVPIDDVVVGDYVFLESGDKAPADGDMISGSIYADESMLSGETKEKFKETGTQVFRGSVITSGSGVMKVLTVGNATFYGKIAKDIQEKTPESPLKNRLRVLATFISRIGYFFAFLVILSYLFSVIFIKNNFDMTKVIEMVSSFKIMAPHLLYALTLGVTIIVVAVPEGLPMMITLVLSSNMKRLLKNNVLVRKLVGIESSGSLNILFSDKTGTITKGKLEVVGFVDYNSKVYKKFDEVKTTKLGEILEVGLVYNNASSFSGNSIIGGNITDRAILSFVNSDDKSKYKVLDKQDFDSKRKYSSVSLDYERNTTFFKGAYEVIVDKVKSYYRSDGSRNLVTDKKSLIELGNKYTKEGYRVLAVATSKSDYLSDLSFVGFLLIKDEVREEAKKGILLVRKAGIQTVMITGDNALTAKVIAKEVGLIQNENDLVITSDELKSMSDVQVKEILPRLRVVARSLPEDKKRLVYLSQEMGLVVGMTGDGVNDAPALKRADVGFAMGSGTEVAKEVSDIIILDDNFLSIAKTVLFGRTIFKSIRKFIIFQLTVNITAVSLSVIGPFFGIIAPVTVIQMLWINMVMDTLAGVAYAFEPPLIEYMEEKPKKRDEKIMNSYMMNEILVTGAYMSFLCMFFLESHFIRGLFRVGEGEKYLMTAFFGLFIFMTIFNAFNARTHRLNIFGNILKNKVFLVIICLVGIIQICLIYFGGSIFRTTGLTFFEFDVMLIMAMSVIPFDFIRKKVLKKFNKSLGV
jgi:calcium-translocating P-type ATPase